ncbi:MAG: NUDIX hydrolase, partial [Pyrinomonadaceae bacterium]
VKSKTFILEFPRGSGRGKEYPEIDRAAWFTVDAARQKILSYQLPFLVDLERIVCPEPPA